MRDDPVPLTDEQNEIARLYESAFWLSLKPEYGGVQTHENGGPYTEAEVADRREQVFLRIRELERRGS